MSAQNPDYYLTLRREYEPRGKINLIIVAESPPAARPGCSALYFYDATGKTTEPLFAAFMLQLGIKPANKAEGLRAFQKKGWILVDATYQPVNEGLTDGERDEVITRHYLLLVADLKQLDRSAPIVLIKANVYRLLETRLKDDGFEVINRGPIPFPATGWQKKFHEEFSAVLKSAGIDSRVLLAEN